MEVRSGGAIERAGIVNSMLELSFWLLAALVVYVYVGYPMLLFALTRKHELPRHGNGELRPNVTLLISAFNEEDCIAEKLDNSLRLDYPKKLLEIIVISDASSDRTDDIVRGYGDRGVKLLRMDDRGGKTLGLNAGVERAEGEMIVFSDANAMYQADAIKVLMQSFSDSRIGAVIGESSYLKPDSDSGRSESLYWRYETTIKQLESLGGSVVGGDGAIYAVRKSLYRPMSADALSDFVNPLQVVQAGYRCVYEPNAVSYEETAGEFGKEYRRKVRIVNRAWRALIRMRAMLNPVRFGGFSLKLLSHKLFRWWVPFMLVAAFGINVILATRQPVYTATLAVQTVFYLLAIVGFVGRKKDQHSLFRVPFYFCLVNIASATGLIEAILGKSYTTWTTARAGR